MCSVPAALQVALANVNMGMCHCLTQKKARIMEVWEACLYFHLHILLEGECHINLVIPKHLFMITADTWNLVQESSLTCEVAGMA